jgi:hypothetical protein
MIAQEKLNNLHKLKLEEVFQIFHECEEVLGLVDMGDAQNILGISKRRIYQKLTPNNSISVGKHKLPLVNLMLK